MLICLWLRNIVMVKASSHENNALRSQGYADNACRMSSPEDRHVRPRHEDYGVAQLVLIT